jgi:hypothetical protein
MLFVYNGKPSPSISPVFVYTDQMAGTSVHGYYRHGDGGRLNEVKGNRSAGNIFMRQGVGCNDYYTCGRKTDGSFWDVVPLPIFGTLHKVPAWSVKPA